MDLSSAHETMQGVPPIELFVVEPIFMWGALDAGTLVLVPLVLLKRDILCFVLKTLILVSWPSRSIVIYYCNKLHRQIELTLDSSWETTRPLLLERSLERSMLGIILTLR